MGTRSAFALVGSSVSLSLRVCESTPGQRSVERRAGFTLVELLVVVAIVGLLIAILSPALSSARAAAQATVCLTHTRTIALVMQMYAEDDPRNFYPTARMPATAPIETSWISLTKPYVDQLNAYRCPTDKSTNFEDAMSARMASYGINAYFTPNHPPYYGVTPSRIFQPSQTIIAAELIDNLTSDHFMPMYWGSPSKVSHAMMQGMQWDAATARPKTVQHTRHIGEANYVFTDGHASAHDFTETFVQSAGQTPAVDWYDVQ